MIDDDLFDWMRPTPAPNCLGCGQSALKAMPPEECSDPNADYLCYHCWEQGTRPSDFGIAWEQPV